MGTGTVLVPLPGIFHFSGGIGTGIGKNWYRKKSRNRYRKNLVPEKSIGTGIGKIWYRKKVSEPVSEKFGTGKSIGTGIGKIRYRKKVPVSVSKIFGTGKKYRYRYRLTFWVPSHTGDQLTVLNRNFILKTLHTG